MKNKSEVNWELALWIRFKSGEKEALAEIYDGYAGILYNYGFHIVNNRALVEDAIQDLFVTLWQSRERLSNTTSIKYYLFRSLRRQLVKLSENVNPLGINHSLAYLEEHPVVPPFEVEIIKNESKVAHMNELQNALKELSPRQLEAIRLYFYEGFDYRSMSQIMEMNEQSVRNLIQRSIGKLRHVMHLIPFFFSLSDYSFQ